MPESAPQQPDDDGRDVDTLTESVELKSVTLESFSAKRHRPGNPAGINMRLELSFAAQPDRLLYRIAVHGDLRPEVEEDISDGGERLAELDLTVLSEWLFIDKFEVSNADLLNQFGVQVVYRLVFPFIREAISSMLARLGFPSVVLGLLRPGEHLPGEASITELA